MTSAPAPRNRWFTIAVLFLIVNTLGVIKLWTRSDSGQTTELRAELVSPAKGRLAGCEALRWRFSTNMVNASETGKVAQAGLLTIMPFVNGGLTWTRTDELTFQPERKWQPCSEFNALLSASLRSLDGRPLSSPPLFKLASAPLTILRARQADLRNDRLKLRLVFNDLVSGPEAMARLKITTTDDKPLPFNLEGAFLDDDGTNTCIQLAVQGISNQTSVIVFAQKGLRGSSGPLALEADTRLEVPLTREFVFEQAGARTESFEDSAIRVAFNQALDLPSAPAFIRVDPDVPFTLEPVSDYSGMTSAYLMRGRFKPGASYALTLRKGLKSELGSALKEDVTRTVYFENAPAAAEFRVSGQYASSQGGRRLPLRMVNVRNCRAMVSRVYPNNLAIMINRQNSRPYVWEPEEGLSKPVAEIPIAKETPVNQVIEQTLELDPALAGLQGAFVVEIVSDDRSHDRTLLVISDSGITVKQSENDLLAWVRSIKTLAPISNAMVQVWSAENQLLASGQTDPSGLVLFTLDPAKDIGQPAVIVVQNGGDISFLNLQESRVVIKGDGEGERPYLAQACEAYLFTDRGIYRPGETAHVKAVVRGRDATCPNPFPVQLTVFRPDGRKDRSFSGMLNALGTAEFEMSWPIFAGTGRYNMELDIPGGSNAMGSAVVHVEDFIPPQVRVSLRAPSDRLAPDGRVTMTVQADHLFGSPAAGLATEARVTFVPAPFMPEAWSQYRFGDPRLSFKPVTLELGARQADAAGRAEFTSEALPRWKPAAALRAVLSGTVIEPSGRAVTANADRYFDPYPFYLGIRPDENAMVQKARVFDLAAVLPEGAALSNSITVRVVVEKIAWVSALKKGDRGTYEYISEEKLTPLLTNSVQLARGQGQFRFTPRVTGAYLLSVLEPSNSVSASLVFNANPAGQSWNEGSLESLDVVQLTADKPLYNVGDTATVTIQAPFTGQALLTLESDRVLHREVIVLTNNTARWQGVIKPEYSPNVHCTMTLIRPVGAPEDWTRYRAAGRAVLAVNRPDRRLFVKFDAPAASRPRQKLEVRLQVTDIATNGVESELVLAAVDEGICMLTDFATPDPHAWFFAPRLPGVFQYDLYGSIMPDYRKQVAAAASAPGGDGPEGLGKRLNPVLAKRFKPVAIWLTGIKTDAQGMATVSLDVPEFTGKLRLMAVAVDPLRFGSAEQQVEVKRPLVVQSSFPRILAPGDKCVVPIRVFNESGTSAWAKVMMNYSGAFLTPGTPASAAGWLNAGAATNFEFLLPTENAGIGRCHIETPMPDNDRYEEDVEIAVRPPASRITVADCGRLDPGAATNIAVPCAWFEGTAASEITLSGLPGIRLRGGLDYLIRYPYGCLEQTTSSAFPLLYLADLANVLYPKWLTPQELDRLSQAGVDRVLSMQAYDGSFSLWPASDVYPWGTLYATHFLVEAASAGRKMPESRLKAACDWIDAFLNQRFSTYAGRAEDPASPDPRLAMAYETAYASHVLALAKRPPQGWLTRLLEIQDRLDRGTRAHLAAALYAAGRRLDGRKILISIPSVPTNAMPRSLGATLRSEAGDDAILLSAWLDSEPDNPAVPALVRRLEAALDNGRWYTTHDNALALMALGKYCKRLGPGKPVTGIVAWDSNRRDFTNVPTIRLDLNCSPRTNDILQIRNTGKTPMYYAWSSEGIPAKGTAKEEDVGLRVRRTFLDQSGQEIDLNEIRQGRLIVVRIELIAPGLVDNVVVEDLLPAGLEIENAALHTSQTIDWVKALQTVSPLRTEIRDDRFLAFTGPFTGRLLIHYTARGVTRGEFTLPPVAASCLYDPAIHSVHGAGKLRVLPPE